MNDAKVLRRSSAFAIAVVVASRSSSFEYTMSVHAVHAGAERNVCNIVVSTETPQTTTNPSQMLLPVYKLAHLPLPHSKSSPPRPKQPLAQQMRYRCKYEVLSTSPNNYLKCVSLSTCTCVYVSVHEILSLIACATTQISLCIFKISPELSLLPHTKYGCR